MKTRKALNILYVVADDNDGHRDVGTEFALDNTFIPADRLSFI